MGREGHCRQMSLACVGSTLSVPATLGLPPLTECVLSRLHCSGSRLLYRERTLCCIHFPGLSCSGSGFCVLHEDADWVGPVFSPFPGRRNSGSQELDERTLPGAGCLITSAVPASVFALVQCAFCLFWEADFWLRPSRQGSTIQNLRTSLVRDWKPVCNLVGECCL